VHLYYLYSEPTNAQLVNNLLYCSFFTLPVHVSTTLHQYCIRIFM